MATKTLAGAAAGTPAPNPRESAGNKRLAKELLAGAEACRELLIGIKAVPIINSGGESRRDYAAADALVAHALDRHGAGAGFRQAMCNYLLALDEHANPHRMTSASLLNDDDGRPVDIDAVDADDGPGTGAERRELAASASYEIESIALMLQSLEDTTDNWFLMRGMFLRIEALNSVVMSVTSGGDEGREIAEMREVLFGLRWRQQLEVSHA